LSVPTGEQANALARVEKERQAIEEKVRAQLAAVRLPETPATSDDPPAGDAEIVWIEDGLPPGAEPQGDEGEASWTWVIGPKHPVFSGKRATWRKSAGLSQHFFTDANPELKLAAADKLFAYV